MVGNAPWSREFSDATVWKNITLTIFRVERRTLLRRCETGEVTCPFIRHHPEPKTAISSTKPWVWVDFDSNCIFLEKDFFKILVWGVQAVERRNRLRHSWESAHCSTRSLSRSSTSLCGDSRSILQSTDRWWDVFERYLKNSSRLSYDVTLVLG